MQRVENRIPEKDYEDAVNGAVVFRFRVVLLFGAAMYLAFGILDRSVYPELASRFFIIRIFLFHLA